MKQSVSTPVVIGIVLAVVAVLGFFLWRGVSGSSPGGAGGHSAGIDQAGARLNRSGPSRPDQAQNYGYTTPKNAGGGAAGGGAAGGGAAGGSPPGPGGR